MSDCNLCQKCHYTKDKDPNAKATAHPENEENAHLKIVPPSGHFAAKAKKPDCTECWGCSTQIQPLKDVMAFGHKFTVEQGASSEWLFHAGQHERAACKYCHVHMNRHIVCVGGRPQVMHGALGSCTHDMAGHL